MGVGIFEFLELTDCGGCGMLKVGWCGGGPRLSWRANKSGRGLRGFCGKDFCHEKWVFYGGLLQVRTNWV